MIDAQLPVAAITRHPDPLALDTPRLARRIGGVESLRVTEVGQVGYFLFLCWVNLITCRR